jgi:hypothetical protein
MPSKNRHKGRKNSLRFHKPAKHGVFGGCYATSYRQILVLVKYKIRGQFTNIFTNIECFNMPEYAILWQNRQIEQITNKPWFYKENQ